MSSEGVFKEYAVLLAKLGYESESLESLVMKWEFFIEQCKDGYRWDYSEYRNEIRVRSLLQELKNCSNIYGAGELKGCFEYLAFLDEEFKSLMQPGVDVEEGSSWWDRGVLKCAGEEYCYYMARAHQILVKNAGG
ncbi:hypothetical protein [Pseudomonas sp. Irchel 3A5]|uniref:hypothetical protein n=1 Tax=Pseudomonas sp. Irchel 3A5 TaxID=2008911 RepID=UPI000BA411E3|nr:hypothetical protein [Pseudomonas sp. Irchel 3A5]